MTALGARAIVTPDGAFADEVRAATGGRGADVILDLVGASYWAENVRALARLGRISDRRHGRRAPRRRRPVRPPAPPGHDPGQHAARPHGRPRRPRWSAEFTEWGVPRLADGRLRPIVNRVLPLTEAAEAHRAVGDDATVGKVVLSVA